MKNNSLSRSISQEEKNAILPKKKKGLCLKNYSDEKKNNCERQKFATDLSKSGK